MSEAHTGLDDLRAALVADGWRISSNGLASEFNLCNWIACRTDDLDLPLCECNDKPPQFCLKPHHMRLDGHESRSVSVYLVAESGGQWFDLCAYGIKADEALQKLPGILPKLAAAWRAVAA